MIKTLRNSLGLAVSIFVLVFLIQFITKLLPAQFLPNEIHVGIPFVFLNIFNLHGNMSQVWHPIYIVCDFVIVWVLTFGVSYLVRPIKLNRK